MLHSDGEGDTEGDREGGREGYTGREREAAECSWLICVAKCQLFAGIFQRYAILAVVQCFFIHIIIHSQFPFPIF